MPKQPVLRSLVFSLVALWPSVLVAQSAFIPPRGEVDLSVTYQFLDTDRHLVDGAVLGPELTELEEFLGTDLQTRALDLGAVRSHAVAIDGDIGVTDRLAVSGSLVFVSARYLGQDPESGIDDGSYYSSVQDARIGARYMVDHGLWAVTPFANFYVPARDYPHIGHVAPGRGLKELELGASVGRVLVIGGAVRAYVEGGYSFALMEDASDDHSLNHSRGRMEVGVFLGRVTAQATANWQLVHGGLDYSDLGHHTTEAAYHLHDREAATREWRIGTGLSFETSDSTAVYISYNDLLWGENTHDARGVTFGLNWAFQAFGGLTIGPFAE